jgi:hypothetical protein
MICGERIRRKRRPIPCHQTRGVGGGFTPRADGGNNQHPIHDEDQEDATPDDYEREIDRLDQAMRAGSDKKI